MKPNLLKFIFALLLVMGMSRQASAVDIQLIHNSPDPSLQTVDIYAVSPFGPPTLVFNDLQFRQIVHQSLPLGGLQIKLAIAPGNSSSISDTFYSTTVTFDNSKNYIFVLQGLRDSSNFRHNPYGSNLSFTVLEKSNARTASSTLGNFDFFFVNGVPDDSAKIVTLRTSNGAAIFTSRFAYGDTTTYFSLPAGRSYILDIYNYNTQKLESTYLLTLPAATAATSVGTIIYSGFADSANNQNGRSAGWFLEIPSSTSTLGTTVMLQKQDKAFLQLIHNSADPSIDTVDVYVNGVKTVNNLGFRAATGTIPVPANQAFTLSFSHKGSTSDSSAFYSVKINPVPALFRGAIVTKGVIDPSKFQVNPNGEAINFGITAIPTLTSNGLSGATAAKVYHGVTDMGKVNVRMNDTGKIFAGGPYDSYSSSYTLLAAKTETFQVMDSANFNKLYAFRMDLTPAHDSTIILLLSGFKSPANNQNGAPVKLIAVLPDGKVIVSTDITGIAEQMLNNGVSVFAYPNPSSSITNVAYRLTRNSDVTLRLMDQTGRVITAAQKGNEASGNYNEQFDLSNLASGLYLIEVQAGDQVSHQWISKQ
jgi:hypothetical protein